MTAGLPIAGETVHVVPEADMLPHALSIACVCDPQEDGWLIVHNAWDQREDHETTVAMPILSWEEWRNRA